MSDAQLAHEEELYGGLADAIRRLAQASVRTTVDEALIRKATAAVDVLAEQLEEQQIDGSFGVSITTSGHDRSYGNAAAGLRNPIAIPLRIQHSPDGRARTSFHLNALYEGPPGLAHGGVIALIMDQVLGEAAAAAGAPGMTGTLSMRYARSTPLGDCSAEAWLDRREGVKTYIKGVMRNADGEDTVSAEGIFILPRWARQSKDGDSPKSFE